MEITGKVYCLFEQSGTFKQEFIKLGIPAEDYDIQNNFGETDHVVDLFDEIEQAYEGGVRFLTPSHRTIWCLLSFPASTSVRLVRWLSVLAAPTIAN